MSSMQSSKSNVSVTCNVLISLVIVVQYRQAYVNVNMTKRSLPATVMPRFRQLDEDDRGDLRRAISKFGGTKEICKKAGLTPIEDWQTNTDAIQYLNN